MVIVNALIAAAASGRACAPLAAAAIKAAP